MELCDGNLCCSLAIFYSLAELTGVMWKIKLFNVLVQSAIFPPVSFEMLSIIFSTMKNKILETMKRNIKEARRKRYLRMYSQYILKLKLAENILKVPQ